MALDECQSRPSLVSTQAIFPTFVRVPVSARFVMQSNEPAHEREGRYLTHPRKEGVTVRACELGIGMLGGSVT